MTRPLLTASIVLFLTTWTFADQSEPASALAKMPVREITVFKDGHAFVLHEGTMPTDAAGNVVMDYLPAPVIGTFWPYSSDKNAKLSSVVAGQRKITVERTTMGLRELLAANIGSEAIINTIDGKTHAGRIVGLPEMGSAKLEVGNPPGAAPMLPKKSNVVLLMSENGAEDLAIDDIRNLAFKGPHKGMSIAEEFRNMLTLKMDWNGKAPKKTADVGMIYLQRGVRWIPNYKIALDGKGNAVVKLQATLLNELTDMEDVTCNLVIGVPTFTFKDTVDPIALQGAVARLSQYFREGQTARGFSNAMMTQVTRMGEVRDMPAAAAPMDLGPEVGGAEGAEDLFIFTVKHVTLKKGQRMVLPVAQYTLPYKDVYVLNIPFAPPPEVFRNFGRQQQTEISRLLAAPKVMHKIRLTNKSVYPLTTAPALILRGERLLAQGIMTYTAIGGTTDLAITAAVDIQVKKLDKETKRIPNAEVWHGDQYARIDLTGAISLTNFRKEAVELEIVRHVLGNATEAGQEGKIEMVNVLEDATFGQVGGYTQPYWWGWYNWPHWWRHFNGVGRITWKLTLDAGKSVDLTYQWHYYWR